MGDAWDPRQYERFAAQRELPFWELLALVRERAEGGGIEPEGRARRGRALDLGCGTGRLTRELHRELRLDTTLGIDSSASMLSGSAAHAGDGVAFELADIASFEPEGQRPPDDAKGAAEDGTRASTDANRAATDANRASTDANRASRDATRAAPFDLVFSNAALHWIDDQRGILRRIAGWLAPKGQLAVQVPANFDHPSHVLAEEIAREEPFASALGGFVRGSPVLAPEAYAELLFELGFDEQCVRLVVYPHVLLSSDELVEWVKGTLLTVYGKRFAASGRAGLYAAYLERYRDRLRERLPHRPLFHPFKRIHLWARRP